MSKLKIFTINIWDIPFGLSKARNERISALSEALAAKNYDIVCLQEIWVLRDFNFICLKVQRKMPYNYYFYSGLFGSGLGIISKWPIVGTFYYKFPLNGYMHKIHHGDWFGGKGVALAQIYFEGKIINVFNTHLHAQYCRYDTDDEYLAHRLSQAFEVGKLVNLCSESGALTLLVGDCNSRPSDICFELLRAVGGLYDSYSETMFQIDGGTNESQRNSFSPPEALAVNPNGNRIDYILYKTNRQHSAVTLSYYFALYSRIPGKNISYSDHEAIAATIELTEKSNSSSISSHGGKPTKINPITQQKSFKVCKNGIDGILMKRKRLFISSCLYILFYVLIVPLLANYTNYSAFTSLLPYFSFALTIVFMFQLVVIHIELRSLRATKMALDLL